MDERDYKAMNEDLKSAEEILQSKFPYDVKIEFGQSNFPVFIQSHEEYASQFQKQLKEKEEEIDRLRSSLFTSERFRMEDAATSIDDRNILHAQLIKSNEMNERLAGALYAAKDLYQRSGWRNELAEKALTEYQNSKK